MDRQRAVKKFTGWQRYRWRPSPSHTSSLEGRNQTDDQPNCFQLECALTTAVRRLKSSTSVRLSLHSSNAMIWISSIGALRIEMKQSRVATLDVRQQQWRPFLTRTITHTHTHNLCAYRNGVKPLDTLSTQHPLYSNAHRERREDLTLVMHLYTHSVSMNNGNVAAELIHRRARARRKSNSIYPANPPHRIWVFHHYRSTYDRRADCFLLGSITVVFAALPDNICVCSKGEEGKSGILFATGIFDAVEREREMWICVCVWIRRDGDTMVYARWRNSFNER